MAETLAIVSAVGGIIGTGMSAIGAYNSAQAQAASARYQAQVAQNNATIAEQNAVYTKQAGNSAAVDASLRARAALGARVAGQAASGIDVNSGSALDAQETEREVGVLNTERVVNNADLQAYGYRSQQSNFAAQAGLLNAQANQYSSSALPAAFGTLLNGASSVGNNFLKLSNSGAFGSTPTWNGYGVIPG